MDFDPNDIEEVDEFDFDPNDIEEVEKYSQTDSALRGAAQGATFGFADEIAGAFGGLSSYVDPNSDPTATWSERYSQSRDASRRAFDDAYKQNPYSYGAGELGASVVTALAPGGLVVKGAQGLSKGAQLARGAQAGSKLAKLGKVARTGTLQAGLYGAGDSEQENLSDVAKDAAKAAALGAGTNLALAGFGKAIPKEKFADAYKYLANKLGSGSKRLAERSAVHATVGNQAKYMDDLVRRGKVGERGRAILDEGLLDGIAPNRQKLYSNATAKKSQIGKELGDLVENEFSDISVDGSKIASKIRSYADDIAGPQNEGVYNQLLKQADAYDEMGSIPMKEAQRLKNQYQWSMTDPSSQSLGKKSTNKLNRILSDSMEESVSDVGGDLTKYTDLKNRYSNIAGAEESVEKMASREQKNRLFSLTDYMAGAAGFSTTGPLGLAAAAGNKFARERGSGIVARSADKVGDLLMSSPQALGKYAAPLQSAAKRGQSAVGTTHFLLWKRDPEYRKLFQGDEDE